MTRNQRKRKIVRRVLAKESYEWRQPEMPFVFEQNRAKIMVENYRALIKRLGVRG